MFHTFGLQFGLTAASCLAVISSNCGLCCISIYGLVTMVQVISAPTPAGRLFPIGQGRAYGRHSIWWESAGYALRPLSVSLQGLHSSPFWLSCEDLQKLHVCLLLLSSQHVCAVATIFLTSTMFYQPELFYRPTQVDLLLYLYVCTVYNHCPYLNHDLSIKVYQSTQFDVLQCLRVCTR